VCVGWSRRPVRFFARGTSHCTCGLAFAPPPLLARCAMIVCLSRPVRPNNAGLLPFRDGLVPGFPKAEHTKLLGSKRLMFHAKNTREKKKEADAHDAHTRHTRSYTSFPYHTHYKRPFLLARGQPGSSGGTKVQTARPSDENQQTHPLRLRAHTTASSSSSIAHHRKYSAPRLSHPFPARAPRPGLCCGSTRA